MGVDNTSIARRYMGEVWSKNNSDAIEELVDDEIVIRDTMGTFVRGKEKLRELVQETLSSFADNTFEIEDLIVGGDHVTLLMKWRGKHVGDFFGVQGTGRSVELECADVLRIVDGKVVEDRAYLDSYDVFQQIGAVPERERLARSRPPVAGGKQDVVSRL